MNKETLLQEENVNVFFNLFNRGTDDQRRLFLHHYERLQEEQDSLKKKKTKQVVKQEQKEQKAKDLLLTQTRLSLSEFQERILQKLKPTRIKLLLRQTRFDAASYTDFYMVIFPRLTWKGMIYLILQFKKMKHLQKKKAVQ